MVAPEILANLCTLKIVVLFSSICVAFVLFCFFDMFASEVTVHEL